MTFFLHSNSNKKKKWKGNKKGRDFFMRFSIWYIRQDETEQTVVVYRLAKSLLSWGLYLVLLFVFPYARGRLCGSTEKRIFFLIPVHRRKVCFLFPVFQRRRLESFNIDTKENLGKIGIVFTLSGDIPRHWHESVSTNYWICSFFN